LVDSDLKNEINNAIQIYIAVAKLWDKDIKFLNTDKMAVRQRAIEAVRNSLIAKGEKIPPDMDESLEGYLEYGQSDEAIVRIVNYYSLPTKKNGDISIIMPKDIFNLCNVEARSYRSRFYVTAKQRSLNLQISIV